MRSFTSRVSTCISIYSCLVFLVLTLVVTILSGCGKSTTAPFITLAMVSVSPSPESLTPGATQQFTAKATYNDGSTADVTSLVTWSSSATAIATISASGVLTAVAPGTDTITAAMNGINATSALTVTTVDVRSLTSITVAPANASFTVGATQQFTATGTYSDSTTSDITSTVTWSISPTSAATINASGLATGVAAGSTTVTAMLSGVAASAALTVTPPVVAPPTLVAIAVTPATATIAVGATQQFRATGTYSDSTTANITSTVSWSMSPTSAATINASGLATGVAAGSAAVTAALQGVSGSATFVVTPVIVSPTLVSIAVTPAAATVAIGATRQYTATGTYTDSSTKDITTTVTWSAANTSVATISSSGLATAVAAGSTTIQAALSGITGSTPLMVTIAPGTGVNVTTWHFDNNRSGLNPGELSLTPANVAPSGFGKLFSYQLDGYAYAEPLLVSNLTIKGAAHNVLFVATENDSVYAFDADNYGTGAPLWKTSLLKTGETPLTGGPVAPVEGVTSTPVIDPVTNTIYVVSSQHSTAAGGTFRLNALDITTGAQKFGGPVTINASVQATNSAAVNGVESLTTSCIQRAALLLANGNIYMGFASCHTGWLLAYSASTLAQVGVFNASTVLNGEGLYPGAGGIWMGSAGPVADSAGNVYVTTGDGPWNGTNAWGESILKFPPTPVPGANGSMQPSDYFTPSIFQFMDCSDADLASGGLLLIPGSSHLLAGGKTGTMYEVNSANLGHESANDAGATQMQVWGAGLPNGDTYTSTCLDVNGTNYTAQITSYEIFGSPAFYNNSVYIGVTPSSSVAPGGVRQFNVSPTGTLTPSTISLPTINQGSRGTTPFISSNGATNGIVWMIDQGNPIQNTNNEPAPPPPPTNATLYAYKADQFPAELYNSSMNPGDTPGYGIKFSSPIVGNGKVYISTAHDQATVANPKGEIDVYGLK